MRGFLRGCLVWLVGYPLSVLAAAAVLTAPSWMDKGNDAIALAVEAIVRAFPVIALFAFLGAVVTPPSLRIWDYVAAGARTGGAYGLIIASISIVLFVSVVARGAYGLLVDGRPAPGAVDGLMTFAGALGVLVSLFAVAGAAGGLVFGLFAADPKHKPN